MRYLKKESKYAARRRRNRLWRGIVTGIAAVVVFCPTSYFFAYVQAHTYNTSHQQAFSYVFYFAANLLILS